MLNRSSGILMPIFSLPSECGIGTFGKYAYEFVDFLKSVGVSNWQILPLHPITHGNSPYQSTSVFAGNLYFIDLELLCENGLIAKEDFSNIDFGQNENKISYDKIIKNKKPIIVKAAKNFLKHNSKNEEFEKFKEEFDYFLKDYAIYSLLKDRYLGIDFIKWDKIHKLHYNDVIDEFEKENLDELEVYKAIQYLFFKQWINLKKYANNNGISIIGDMPIYSSLDSSEVFANYKNFFLDENRNPIAVAGCPPDGFCQDGQIWNNPLYDYDYIKNTNYKYFVDRLKHLNILYDVIRIDHFRGFASYYSIPFGSKNAHSGKWEIGPGIDLFNKIKNEVPDIQIIAEDLGIIDDSVKKLLNETGFPGMKVVEFAFDDNPEYNPYLPKNYVENCVAYLGTHDNDTFMGWFNKLSCEMKDCVKKYLNIQDDENANLDAIKELFMSKAMLTIVSMQDLLGLDTFSRINIPSTVSNDNWSYKFSKNYLDTDNANFLKNLIREVNR